MRFVVLLALTACNSIFGLGEVALADGAVSHQQIAFVQQATGAAMTGTTVSAALPAAPSVGDILILVGATRHGALASTTGGGVAQWTRATSSMINTSVEIWYGVVADGSNRTISIAASSSAALWLSVSEWSGVATNDPVDATVAAGAQGTDAFASPGALTPHVAPVLLVLGISEGTAAYVTDMPSDGPWTALDPISAGSVVQAEWYGIDGTARSHAPGVPADCVCWDAALAAFRAGP